MTIITPDKIVITLDAKSSTTNWILDNTPFPKINKDLVYILTKVPLSSLDGTIYENKNIYTMDGTIVPDNIYNHILISIDLIKEELLGITYDVDGDNISRWVLDDNGNLIPIGFEDNYKLTFDKIIKFYSKNDLAISINNIWKDIIIGDISLNGINIGVLGTTYYSYSYNIEAENVISLLEQRSENSYDIFPNYFAQHSNKLSAIGNSYVNINNQTTLNLIKENLLIYKEEQHSINSTNINSKLYDFPEFINIRCGDFWNGDVIDFNGIFNENKDILLQKITVPSTFDEMQSWTENGTTIPNISTNKILLTFDVRKKYLTIKVSIAIETNGITSWFLIGESLKFLGVDYVHFNYLRWFNPSNGIEECFWYSNFRYATTNPKNIFLPIYNSDFNKDCSLYTQKYTLSSNFFTDISEYLLPVSNINDSILFEDFDDIIDITIPINNGFGIDSPFNNNSSYNFILKRISIDYNQNEPYAWVENADFGYSTPDFVENRLCIILTMVDRYEILKIYISTENNSWHNVLTLYTPNYSDRILKWYKNGGSGNYIFENMLRYFKLNNDGKNYLTLKRNETFQYPSKFLSAYNVFNISSRNIIVHDLEMSTSNNVSSIIAPKLQLSIRYIVSYTLDVSFSLSNINSIKSKLNAYAINSEFDTRFGIVQTWTRYTSAVQCIYKSYTTNQLEIQSNQYINIASKNLPLVVNLQPIIPIGYVYDERKCIALSQSETKSIKYCMYSFTTESEVICTNNYCLTSIVNRFAYCENKLRISERKCGLKSSIPIYHISERYCTVRGNTMYGERNGICCVKSVGTIQIFPINIFVSSRNFDNRYCGYSIRNYAEFYDIGTTKECVFAIATSSNRMAIFNRYIKCGLSSFKLYLSATYTDERYCAISDEYTFYSNRNCSYPIMHINERRCSFNQYLKVSINAYKLGVSILTNNERYCYYTAESQYTERYAINVMDIFNEKICVFTYNTPNNTERICKYGVFEKGTLFTIKIIPASTHSSEKYSYYKSYVNSTERCCYSTTRDIRLVEKMYNNDDNFLLMSHSDTNKNIKLTTYGNVDTIVSDISDSYSIDYKELEDKFDFNILVDINSNKTEKEFSLITSFGAPIQKNSDEKILQLINTAIFRINVNKSVYLYVDDINHKLKNTEVFNFIFPKSLSINTNNSYLVVHDIIYADNLSSNVHSTNLEIE